MERRQREAAVPADEIRKKNTSIHPRPDAAQHEVLLARCIDKTGGYFHFLPRTVPPPTPDTHVLVTRLEFIFSLSVAKRNI